MGIIDDHYNRGGYKNELLFCQVYGENWQIINDRPFNDKEINYIRSNCVMDNKPKKVARLRIKPGGYIYIPLISEVEDLPVGSTIDLKSVKLVRLGRWGTGLNRSDHEVIIRMSIQKYHKEEDIGSKIYIDGEKWEIIGKRALNNMELEYVSYACIVYNKPTKHVLFFTKEGNQHTIPLSEDGEDYPIGSSIDLKNAHVVTCFREGDGSVIRIRVYHSNHNECTDANKKSIKDKEKVLQNDNKKCTIDSKKNLRTKLYDNMFFIGVLLWGIFVWIIIISSFLSRCTN